MTPSQDRVQVGFIGLGAMGFGMASHLLKNPVYDVVAYDVYAPSVDKFVASGGRAAASPRAAATSSHFLVLMVQNAAQCNAALFDSTTGAIKGMKTNHNIHESWLTQIL
jgi:3-hydroxyisobutyrate dehydrogenase